MQAHSFLLFFSVLLLWSCNGKSDAGNEATATSTEQPTATEGTSLPSIPIDRLEYLWNNADYLDVVFYELPASINQSTQDGIRTTIMHIGEQTPTLKPECKSIGRLFFQEKGKNIEQAEIYFQPGCAYYVWLENDKPAYANVFTKEGVGFYYNIIESVKSGGQ